MSCAGIAAHSVSSEVSAHQTVNSQSNSFRNGIQEPTLKKTGRGPQISSRRRWLPRSCCSNFHQTLRRHSPPLLPQATVILSFFVTARPWHRVGRLRQCVTPSRRSSSQQSFDEAVDVPVALHDRQKAVSSTGPVHWQDRRFPSCVATPSTNNPDDTAKVKVSQGQP